MCDCGVEDAEDGVATGALPAAMSQQQQQHQQLIGTDVNIGDVTLSCGMKPSLQRLCDATDNPAEKAKALELLTALEMSTAIKADATAGNGGRFVRRRAATPAASSTSSSCDGTTGGGGRYRPRTAAPRLQQAMGAAEAAATAAAAAAATAACCNGGGGGSTLTYVNSYETTHDYYYQPPVPSPSKAVRPASSQLQRVVPPPSQLAPGNSYSDLFMSTTYGREYFAKNADAQAANAAAAAAAETVAASRPAAERAASARGVRNNNPHPSREFLVWRYRRPMTATEKIEEAAACSEGQSSDSQPWECQPTQKPTLDNDSFDRAVRGKCRSTYQHDYLGVPTSFDVDQRAVSLLALEQKQRRPAYDRSSTSRGAFGQPAPVPPELSVSGIRFGEGSKNAAAASSSSGIIPAGGLGGRALDARTRTTYEAHISEPGGRLMRVADLRELSNAQNALAVARLLDCSSSSSDSVQRAGLMKLHREMQSRRLPASIPMPVERRILRERVGGHMRLPNRPAWQSSWTGPGAA